MSNIPILKSIKGSTKEARKAALKETGFTIFFSTVPIWALPILFGIFTKEKSSEMILANISGGELYLFATALIGPMVCWILADYLIEPKEKQDTLESNMESENEFERKETFSENVSQKFPDALALIGVLFLLALGSCFAVFLLKSSTSKPWTFEVNDTALFWGSIIVFILCSFILYCVLCFKHDLQNPLGVMRKRDKDFQDDFSNFAGS